MLREVLTSYPDVYVHIQVNVYVHSSQASVSPVVPGFPRCARTGQANPGMPPARERNGENAGRITATGLLLVRRHRNWQYLWCLQRRGSIQYVMNLYAGPRCDFYVKLYVLLVNSPGLLHTGRSSHVSGTTSCVSADLTPTVPQVLPLQAQAVELLSCDCTFLMARCAAHSLFEIIMCLQARKACRETRPLLRCLRGPNI